MSAFLINTQVYKPDVLKALDLCNIIQTERILNKIYGNEVSNIFVLRMSQKKELQQIIKAEKQFIEFRKISSLESKLQDLQSKNNNKQQIIKKYRQQDYQLKGSNINNIQMNNHTSAVSSQMSKSNKNKEHGEKKKFKKFQKPKISCQNQFSQIQKPITLTPVKSKENQFVSAKFLLIKQSLLCPNKSSINLGKTPQENDQKYSPINYRSFSASSTPKKIINVKYSKSPKIFKQFHQINSSNQSSPHVGQFNGQNQVQFVRHKTNFWPMHKPKKQDVIDTMENLADSRKNKQEQNHPKNRSKNELSHCQNKSNIKNYKQQTSSYQNEQVKSSEKVLTNKTKKQKGKKIFNTENRHYTQIKPIQISIQICKQEQNQKIGRQDKKQLQIRENQTTYKADGAVIQPIKNNKQKAIQDISSNSNQNTKLALDRMYIKAIGNKYLQKILENHQEVQSK